ncbi:3-(3-hydroxyphenyl)propionate hydroxylase [Streptomyces venezuelae]|uniref:3-(3-hydroxyphenyl)propionate hydroxylase n=1 Tax=Streptomyces venezuelae TaxID=54571 RepID=A0A5P2D1A0_STRVZ|nr:FAD-dependent monooxygenase [Streptomyces venezuelae]QES47121.1 3-(3-hydroxyphenyl)propionate hydroxylase [Streptomyces venezuelae]
MTDVLIVGAGPTGLTLGCELARRGIGVRIVDQRGAPHGESRGKTLNADGLAVLEDLGVAARIEAIGHPDLVFRKYFDGVHIADTVVEGTLFIGQWQIEQVLRERLAGLGVVVEYDARVTAVTQDEDGVTAAFAAGRPVRARHLAGCDGGGSSVRRLLGIGFEGHTDGERAMVVGDVRAPGLDREVWHQWFTSDGEAMMLCPIPRTDIFQLQASPERDTEGRPLPPSAAGFQRLFERHARMPGIRPADPSWLSTWRVNVRMAERMRRGRAFLAGDAAHVHPIAGGLGMNTGIQDAAALARALGGETDLEEYEAARLPAAARLLADSTGRMERVLEAVRTPGIGTEAGLG